MGARLAGVELRGGIDMDPVATETYRANFPEAHVVTDRLESVSLPALKRKLGPIDLLLASPECTNHTCAKGSAPRDETSRATAMAVVEYARAFRPRWVVLENVVHMRPWSRYGELKRSLEELGYLIEEMVLDAKDFGVPQKRRRLFIVGDRKRRPDLVAATEPRTELGAATILDQSGRWPTTLLRSDRRAADTLARAERAFAAIGDKTPFLVVYYSSDGAGGWQTLSQPLRTVTTIDRFALVAPGEQGPVLRMLQVPELRRAMGFDEAYLFPVGTRRDRIRLLGNGVCPPVMTAVVRALTADKPCTLKANDPRSRRLHARVRDQVHQQLLA